MLTLMSIVLATAAAASEPIQVQSTPARQSSNKASGFGKNVDQNVFAPLVTSVSTASIDSDGSVQVHCETHHPESHELNEHDEQPK